MKPLTFKQQAMLDYLFDYLESTGTSPSPLEIAAGVGINAGSISLPLRKLEWAGLIEVQKLQGRKWLVNAVNHPTRGTVEIEEAVYVPEVEASFFASDLPDMGPIVRRNCLNCNRSFEVRSRFLRLCPPCRAEATSDYAPTMIGSGYTSNAAAIMLGVPGFGMGGFHKGPWG